MAVLYITEYAGLMPSPVGGQGQVPMEPALARQQVAITASSVPSSAFNAKTRIIRIHTDAICATVVDTTPVAAVLAGDRRVAGSTEFTGVPLGGSYKIAVIATT